MSLIYERTVDGPGTHAFIIGVGSYPYAKPGTSPFGQNLPLPLRDIRDLDSAPAGAKLFADWLISHADDLPAPLASVNLALSAPPGTAASACEYEWKTRLQVPGNDPRMSPAVSSTDGAAVELAGKDWAKRFQSVPNQIAVFYICGHGAAVPTRSVVLLSDVAGPTYMVPWQPHVDVQYLAGAMCRLEKLKEGYVFVDACQEVVAEMLLAMADESVGIGEPVRFFPQSSTASKNKVLLLVPGSIGKLAFDDGKGGGGRYTQVLVKALNGAGARNYTGAGKWGVLIDGLPRTLKLLYGLRGWPPDEFDPVPIKTLVTGTPLIRHPEPPEVPFAVMLDPPEAMNQAGSVFVVDAARNMIVPRNDKAEQWIGWAQARMGLCYVRATFNGAGAPYNSAMETSFDLSEMRLQPVIVHRVIE